MKDKIHNIYMMVQDMYPKMDTMKQREGLLEIERALSSLILDLEAEDAGTTDLWSL